MSLSSFFSSLKTRIAACWQAFDVHKAIAKAVSFLESFGLTQEHLDRIHAEVKAVEDAVHPDTGAALTGAEKAVRVADALGTLAGDLNLPQPALDNLHTVISTVHTIDRLATLIR